MSWFNTEIIYVKGSENHVADCLSHYYEREEGDSASDEEIDWANMDVCLDLEGDNLPQNRWLKLKAITIEGEPNPQKSKCLAEKWAPCTSVKKDPTVFESARTSQVPLMQYRNQPGFLNAVCRGYKSKPILAKVLA